MKLQKSHAVWNRAYRREAFTLIELLIVMSIITLLAALVAGATILYIGRQRESNTKATIAKVFGELDWQWRSVVDDAKTEYKTLSGNVLTALNSMATPPGGALDAERAQVIWIKCRLRQQFPMNFTEITTAVTMQGPSGPVTMLPTVPAYANALGNTAQTSNPPNAAESGAALLIALTTQTRHGRSTSRDLFGSQAILDTNADGVPELVDGWGQPLAYWRWPVANPELDALNPNNTGSTPRAFQDPCDQQGRLLADNWNNYSNWSGSKGCQQFEQNFHLIHGPLPPTTTTSGNYVAQSWYLIPVIASAGPDGKFGLQQVSAPSPDPMLIANQPQANDNIYSYNVMPR